MTPVMCIFPIVFNFNFVTCRHILVFHILDIYFRHENIFHNYIIRILFVRKQILHNRKTEILYYKVNIFTHLKHFDTTFKTYEEWNSQIWELIALK